jgi:hypothetical protein
VWNGSDIIVNQFAIRNWNHSTMIASSWNVRLSVRPSENRFGCWFAVKWKLNRNRSRNLEFGIDTGSDNLIAYCREWDGSWSIFSVFLILSETLKQEFSPNSCVLLVPLLSFQFHRSVQFLIISQTEANLITNTELELQTFISECQTVARIVSPQISASYRLIQKCVHLFKSTVKNSLPLKKALTRWRLQSKLMVREIENKIPKTRESFQTDISKEAKRITTKPKRTLDWMLLRRTRSLVLSLYFEGSVRRFSELRATLTAYMVCHSPRGCGGIFVQCSDLMQNWMTNWGLLVTVIWNYGFNK